MVTKIWFVGKTKGSEALVFPNCKAVLFTPRPQKLHDRVDIFNIDTDRLEAAYALSSIARVEFRP